MSQRPSQPLYGHHRLPFGPRRPITPMTPLRSHGKILLLGLLTMACPACQDLGPPTPKGPGAIHVDLESPNGAEGSAVFQISGGTGLGVVSSFGGEVFYDHNYGTEVTLVVVVMDVPGEIQFKIRTANVRDLPTVSLLQVADGNDVLRGSLEGYQVEAVRVEDGGSS